MHTDPLEVIARIALKWRESGVLALTPLDRRSERVRSACKELLREPLPHRADPASGGSLWLIPAYLQYGIAFGVRPPERVEAMLKDRGYVWSGKRKLWERAVSAADRDGWAWGEHREEEEFFAGLCELVATAERKKQRLAAETVKPHTHSVHRPDLRPARRSEVPDEN